MIAIVAIALYSIDITFDDGLEDFERFLALVLCGLSFIDSELVFYTVSYTHLTLPTICSV